MLRSMDAGGGARGEAAGVGAGQVSRPDPMMGCRDVFGLDVKPFFLFGLGNRPKLIYQAGWLWETAEGQPVKRWDAASEEINPVAYSVRIVQKSGAEALVREDEDGIWLEEEGRRKALVQGHVSLPGFENHPHGALLRVLHHEVLINVVAGRPLPNFLAYDEPWYRDAAMMAMVLKGTGNLRLIREWVRGLKEPYDRNNGGEEEPDNLGQVLYLISLCAERSHPLVRKVQDEIAARFPDGVVRGRTDFGEHPVYQTKWLKFGLRALGLPDPFVIPAVPDSYSSLFWMGFRDEHLPGRCFDDAARRLYPYLGWAEDHFHGRIPEDLPDPSGYPLTWEAEASQANYANARVLGEAFMCRRICAPHSWHAAEMFLALK